MKTNKLYNEVSKKENLTNSNNNNNNKIMENINKDNIENKEEIAQESTNDKSIDEPMKEPKQKTIKEMYKQVVATSIFMTTIIMSQKEDGYTSEKKKYKFGLIKGNRLIDSNRVIDFIQCIHSNKYESIMPIITMKAEELITTQHVITDYEGNPITEEEAKDYLIVLEGQHRVAAFARYNTYENANETIDIPNVHIKTGLENIGEYLAEINLSGKSWSLTDKVCVAAISTGNETLMKVNELIKQGYSGSTAFYIYTRQRVTNSKVEEVLKGGDSRVLFGNSSESDEKERIERGDKYIDTAMRIEGMSTKVLKKRFYVEQFYTFMIARPKTDSESFQILGKLSLKDFTDVKSGTQEEFSNRLAQASEQV